MGVLKVIEIQMGIIVVAGKRLMRHRRRRPWRINTGPTSIWMTVSYVQEMLVFFFFHSFVNSILLYDRRMFDSNIAKMRRESTSILVFCLCIAIISAIDDLITSQFHPLMVDAKEKNNNINHERKLLILAAAAAIPVHIWCLLLTQNVRKNSAIFLLLLVTLVVLTV